MRKYGWILGLFFLGSCGGGEDLDLEESLMLQYKQIIALSKSKSCTDMADWRFTGIGAKPCGGPSDFIAYSKDIDTVQFLDLVSRYNQDSRKLNEKKGLISDCAIIPGPTGIVCEDGDAILQYLQN